MHEGVSDYICGERIANSYIDTVIISAIISLLILIIATSVILTILLCLRRRKREPELMEDNAAYHSHTAHHTANDIVTVTNEAYTATSVPTSPNPAYQPSRESVDIATETNMAYAATDIATSVNPAYQPMQDKKNEHDCTLYSGGTDNKLEYDYPQQE